MSSGRTPQQVRETAIEFIKRVNAALPETRIYYIGLPYVLRAKTNPQSLAAIKGFNQEIAGLARETKHLEFIDIFSAFLDEDNQPRTDLFVEDGIHFTAEAYAIIAGLLREKL